MPDYIVEWTIQLDAETPSEAAAKALEMHRDPKSRTTVFSVIDDQGDVYSVDPSNLYWTDEQLEKIDPEDFAETVLNEIKCDDEAPVKLGRLILWQLRNNNIAANDMLIALTGMSITTYLEKRDVD